MSVRPSAGDGGQRGRRGTQFDLNRPKFTILHIAGSGYIVLDPGGQKCSGTFRNKDGALTRRDALQAEADRRAKRCERPCMCCGVAFDSQGIHNRLCPGCRHRGAEDGPHGLVLPRRRTQ